MGTSVGACLGKPVSAVVAGGLRRNATRKAIEAYAYGQMGEGEAESSIPPDLLVPRLVEMEGPFWVWASGDEMMLEVRLVTGRGLSVQCYAIEYPDRINEDAKCPELLPGEGETISDIRFTRTDNRTSAIDVCLDSGRTIHIAEKGRNIEVTYLSKTGERERIPFSLFEKGLSDWEYLHCDTSIRFTARSPFVFVRTRKTKGNPTFYSLDEDNEHRLTYIPRVECDWFYAGVIIAVRGEMLAFHKESIPRNQWDEILASATRVLAFRRFDALYTYLAGLHISQYFDRPFFSEGEEDYFFTWLNENGADFWKRRFLFRQMCEDVKRWTTHALHPQDGVGIENFYV